MTNQEILLKAVLQMDGDMREEIMEIHPNHEHLDTFEGLGENQATLILNELRQYQHDRETVQGESLEPYDLYQDKDQYLRAKIARAQDAMDGLYIPLDKLLCDVSLILSTFTPLSDEDMENRLLKLKKQLIKTDKLLP